MDGTNISIDSVDSEEYNATVIEEVIDSQEVDDLITEVQEESDYELEVYKADSITGITQPKDNIYASL